VGLAGTGVLAGFVFLCVRRLGDAAGPALRVFGATWAAGLAAGLAKGESVDGILGGVGAVYLGLIAGSLGRVERLIDFERLGRADSVSTSMRRRSRIAALSLAAARGTGFVLAYPGMR
jgi:hypothetical protein